MGLEDLVSRSTRVARWFCFQTKNPNLGKFWEGLRLENVYIFYGHLEYFMSRLNHFVFICNSIHLKHFVFIWDTFSGLGIVHREKSGNLAVNYFFRGGMSTPFSSVFAAGRYLETATHILSIPMWYYFPVSSDHWNTPRPIPPIFLPVPRPFEVGNLKTKS
jgi:hypothetical protein